MRRCSRGHFIRAGGHARCKICRRDWDHAYSVSEKGRTRRRAADKRYYATLASAVRTSRYRRGTTTRALEAQREDS